MVQFPPPDRIEFPEEFSGLDVPTPPEIACKAGKAFISGRDQLLQSPNLPYDGTERCGRCGQDMDGVGGENPRVNGLQDQYILQQTPIAERNAEKGMVRFLAG